MAYIKINGDVIKSIVEASGYSVQSANKAINRSPAYLGLCIHRGTMSGSDADFFCKAFNCSMDDIIYHDPIVPIVEEFQEPCENIRCEDLGSLGYHIDLEITPKKVGLILSHNGEQLYRAKAYIKGDREVDLIQSISYAAHMLYKLAEQDSMEED